MRTHQAAPRLDGAMIVENLREADRNFASATERMRRALLGLATMGKDETPVEQARRIV